MKQPRFNSKDGAIDRRTTQHEHHCRSAVSIPKMVRLIARGAGTPKIGMLSFNSKDGAIDSLILKEAVKLIKDVSIPKMVRLIAKRGKRRI